MLLIPSKAQAFEALPQFRGLNPNQARSFDDPSRLDSEYSSDHLTYQKPIEWEILWLSQDIVFDLSTGSLSGRHFQTEDRLKLQQSLYRELVEFRFTYLSQSDFEEEVEHHVMELVFTPWRKSTYIGSSPASWLSPWGLALYGETALYKAENNMGVALLYLGPQSENRLFANFPQFAHNRRNINGDFFSEGEGAKTYGVAGHWWDQENFFRYTLRLEPQARWIFPQDQREYRYRRSHASLWWQREMGRSQYWLGRLQWDHKREGEAPTEITSSIEEGEWQRTRLFAQSQWRHWWKGLEWTWGLAYFEREWHSPEGKVLQRDLLPHFWVALPERAHSLLSQGWHIGFEMTHHRRSPSLTSAEGSELPFFKRNEHRLNIKYALDFHQGQSKMNFLFTFDLDEFGTHRTWEGGAIQFRSHF